MGEDQIVDVATRLHAASIRLLRRRGDEGAGLSARRLSALSAIAAAGPLSLAELAAAEQVRPPTMSRIVDALLAAGLVTREPDPKNRRSVRIAVTEEGVRAMAAGRARRVQALAGRLGRLSDYERRALTRGLEVLERVAG
jgi:DNA-binding MarR family transcriptional regulator